MKIMFLALDINIKISTGDAIHVRELAISLASLGHKVSLVVPDTKDKSTELAALQNQKNLQIFFIEFKPHFRTISTILSCRRIAKNQKPDIIYERRFTPKISYALNKLLKIPFVVEINGLKDKEKELHGSHDLSHPHFRKLRRRIWRHLFKSSKQVVVVSEGLKKGLSEEYGINREKISVIFNGANTDLFKPLDREKCLEELGLDKSYKYIGFIGNLAPWQGVDQLISISPEIINRSPNSRFLIVGGGVMEEELKKSASKLGMEDYIIFTGFIPYKKIPKYINAFDICVAPFNKIERNVKYSFSAIKLYEYMACGKPIVTTDVVGIKNEILDKKMGIIVKADDIPNLISSILNLLSNIEMQESMGNTAREWVLNEHSWIKVAERVAGVCEKSITGTTII